MNITIDKAPTLEAIQQAEAAFLSFKDSARKAKNEQAALYWERQAHWIAVLREQIWSHGKVANDAKPN